MLLELTGIESFLYLLLIFLIVLTIRYFLTAGIFYWYFYKFNYGKWKNNRLSSKALPSKSQQLNEIKWSLVTSVIFALLGVVTIWLYQQGYTAVYENIREYGYFYLPLSLLAAMFIHETYYYWVHRWMHRKSVFKPVHKVHHDSITPSPWSAFSFHPWEGLIEAVILPLILIIVPLHPVVILTYLLIMTISSVINHLDIEIFPERFQTHWLGKWIIGATHHHYHHKEFKTNYGLYFTFWDKWMNTESIKYNKGARKDKESSTQIP